MVSEIPDAPVGQLTAAGWEANSHTLHERTAAYRRPINTPPQREEQPGRPISAIHR
ncbi:hypothetical protein Stsp01_53560 [Streptomyces sp. NBRC 13847]|nr:hypothetical protein Stsp01_53560 [Streptomyces sp. NBRC 13847]